MFFFIDSTIFPSMFRMKLLLFLICTFACVSAQNNDTYAHNFVTNELGFIVKQRGINIGKTVESMLLGVNMKALGLESYTDALVYLQANMLL
jgi:hypothetical protein